MNTCEIFTHSSEQDSSSKFRESEQHDQLH